ncbi:hypothetical protein CKN63_13460 [Carnobacterium divergens]|uniref:hypothetical protein n=1 Tax=Carnobacterium divergens TaxID=2748 RepID=UPI001071762C|nr:hypothetical protein [Carnobacterium divergens]TFI60566.1 hypothetical protein CKN59_13395 [Carnobacterium divergens]TFI61635.1 hypothetical protein CKN76_12590 [Carnobacterium divergens]TFJ01041.1 hypothetical protein CKN75_12985 [Carnobacterium divergens]TFJ08961.1 hypothetical protein CKN71_13000 [Carnobacterium divergens]TFJ15670.1 hypothetical protein CKN63_13460 [Carnobacterium divergens]
MKKDKNAVMIKINRLEELMANDFKVSNFEVGTDLLELRVPNEIGEKEGYLELTIWVNGKGQIDGNQGEAVELLIGNRDSVGDIEIIEDEGLFDFKSYESVENLLESMVDRIIEESKYN